MLFSSITFIYIFLPVLFILYYLAPGPMKNGLLLAASLIFYGFETPKFLPIMLGCIALTYVNGRLIEVYRNRLHYGLSILLCLIPLIYFKYCNFFIKNINSAFKLDITLLKVVLPLGISFYTFQMISYLVDVKRGTIPAEKNILNLALYITFFPQLIAGPIVQYKDVRLQITGRRASLDQINEGVFLFCVGMGKKILIANQLGSLCSYYVPGESTILMAWMYTFAYTLQVYFDFSGYSTMAIGLGKLFGFELPMNFNYPLICCSIKDFWTRWHMTLSGFFKDYVYIPLGGSRCKTARNVFNLAVVWFLTGFWHGADWTFICWGLFFFVLLLCERYIIKDRLNVHVQRPLAIFMVLISFVLFGADSLTDFIISVKNLFAGSLYDGESLFIFRNFIGILLIAMFFATPAAKRLYEKYIKEGRFKMVFEGLFVAVVLLISTGYLISGSFNPFLYFRF